MVASLTPLRLQHTVPSETLYSLGIFSISIIKVSISCNHTQFSRHLHRIMVSTHQIQPPRRSHRRPSSARAIGGSTLEKCPHHALALAPKSAPQSQRRSERRQRLWRPLIAPQSLQMCTNRQPTKMQSFRRSSYSPSLYVISSMSYINMLACIKRITIVLQSKWLWKPIQSAVGPLGRRYSSPGVVALQT